METPHITSDTDNQDYREVGQMVEALNNELNNGRGINAIRDVASALKRGQVESA